MIGFGCEKISQYLENLIFLIKNSINLEYTLKYFKKQALSDLNPKTFQFSKIISEFEFSLYDFVCTQPIPLREDKLRRIKKYTFPEVET